MIFGNMNRDKIKCHIDKSVCITTKCSAWTRIPILQDESLYFHKAIKDAKLTHKQREEYEDLKPEALQELSECCYDFANSGYCGLINKIDDKQIIEINNEAFVQKLYKILRENDIK